MSSEVVIKENVNKSKITKKKIVILMIALIALISGYMIYSFNNNYIYNGKIANNIFVEGVNISLMTKEKAVDLISQKHKPQAISLNYNDNSFSINPEDIDLKYNIEEVVNNAYNYTKTDSYFENVKRLFQLDKTKKEYTLKNSFDEAKLSSKLEQIASEVNVPVRNAKLLISGGSFNVTPSITGKEFDISSNKEAIYEAINSRNYGTIDLKINDIEPDISTAMASSVNTLLSEHTTKFNASMTGRTENIRISSNRISDVLLMPGETYSYNKQTGVRTISNGFYNAPVIINGDLEDAPGGGVCQTSTTLYNAVLYSGLNIEQVKNHSITSSYAPRGKDAMVNDSGSDLKFSNPYSHPIYIKSYVSGNSVTCQVYGNAEDKPNVEIKVENFHMGAKTYRVFKDDSGNEIKTEYIATSVYKK